MVIASLDSQSRRSIREFSLQLGIGCATVIGLSVAGVRPWSESVQLLAFLCSLYSLWTIARAIRKKDQLGAPSLNLWDEAVAFSGCSFLLRGLLELHS